MAIPQTKNFQSENIVAIVQLMKEKHPPNLLYKYALLNINPLLNTSSVFCLLRKKVKKLYKHDIIIHD